MTTLFETDMQMGADFSPCRTWRYSLWRIWEGNKGLCMFIGLNPSTADETQNDPTIRRCISFAKDWGYSGLYMLNLFAYRSTDPAGLKNASDPIGPQNDRYLKQYGRQCSDVIAAWGIHGVLNQRNKEVPPELGVRMRCLGKTKAGHPKHPLYLKSDTTRELYWSPTP